MKPCRDCRHFVDLRSSFAYSARSACANPDLAGVDLVYSGAKHAYADVMRDDETKCGADAKGWAPKPPHRSLFARIFGRSQDA